MEPMAYIGAGMCALSMMAAAWGVSQVWTTIISIVGRNPQVKKDVDIYGWGGFSPVGGTGSYRSGCAGYRSAYADRQIVKPLRQRFSVA